MSHQPYLPEPERTWLAAGSAIAGSAAGALMSLGLRDPAGVVVGAAAGTATVETLTWSVKEFSSRILSHREQARCGAVVEFAAERFGALLNAGATPRGDGFFDSPPKGRSAGRELIEGVLMTARRQYEERKIRHIGYLFARAATDESLDGALLNSCLSRAESLSWRQYVLLAAIHRRDRLPLSDMGDILDDAGSWTGWGARQELHGLYESRYVWGGYSKTEVTELPYPNQAIADQREAHSAKIMHHLLDLDFIPDREVLHVHDQLRPTGSPGGV